VNWSPVPLWRMLTVLTGLLAAGVTIAWAVGCQPPTAGAAADPKQVNGIHALERKFDARLDREIATLVAKIDSQRADIDRKLENLTQLINSSSMNIILKELLSIEREGRAPGPITIINGGKGGEPTNACTAMPSCCCQPPSAGAPSCRPRSDPPQSPKKCH